jgi:hypothetical protein
MNHEKHSWRISRFSFKIRKWQKWRDIVIHMNKKRKAMKNWKNCWQKSQKQQNELFNQMTRIFAFEQRMSQRKKYEQRQKSHWKIFEQVFNKER